MKRMSIYSAVICLLIFYGAGCAEDENKQKDLSVSFKFQLLDEHGVPFSAFREGENIVFSFQIINFSRKTIFFQSMETEEFMMVYLIDTTGVGQPVSVGKPYSDIFCTGDLSILRDDTLKMEIPWVAGAWNPGERSVFCGVNENTSLSLGHYKTAFATTFNFIMDNKQYSTEFQEFQVEFEVHECEGEFKNRPLEQVRSCVKGEWELLYSEGGFGGIWIEATDTYIVFKMGEVDSLFWIEEGRITVGEIEWILVKDDRSNVTYHAKHIETGIPYLIREIYNDTLIMYEIIPEGFTHTLIRSYK